MLKINFCQLLECDWRNEDKKRKDTKAHEAFLSIVWELTATLYQSQHGATVIPGTSHLLFTSRLEIAKRKFVKGGSEQKKFHLRKKLK